MPTLTDFAISRKIRRLPSLTALFTVLGIALLALGACGKAPNEASGSSAGIVSNETPPFVAVAESLSSNSKYQVRLKWNAKPTPLVWILDRYVRVGNRNHLITTVLNGTDSQYVDTDVIPGKRYTYYLTAQAPYRYGLMAEVSIPRRVK
jgi:hypothetical protein